MGIPSPDIGTPTGMPVSDLGMYFRLPENPLFPSTFRLSAKTL